MNETFETTSFYLAAYLLANHHRLTAYQRKNSKQVSFQFKDSNELIQHINEFTLDKEALVDANALISAIKRLKGIIYDG